MKIEKEMAKFDVQQLGLESNPMKEIKKKLIQKERKKYTQTAIGLLAYKVRILQTLC